MWDRGTVLGRKPALKIIVGISFIFWMCSSFSASPEDLGLADSHPLQPTASGYIK